MKAKITWNSTYNIGINQIDSQHRLLFTIAEKILSFKKPTEHKEEVSELIKALLTNLTVHFNTEEALFVKFKYPFKELHIQKHMMIRNEIVEMIKKNNSLEKLVYDLPSVLEKWLVEHMLEDDKNFAKWASSKEAQQNSSTAFF
ncbi:MAG: bacteriohemerythrin [Bacteroidota bacterium]